MAHFERMDFMVCVISPRGWGLEKTVVWDLKNYNP